MTDRIMQGKAGTVGYGRKLEAIQIVIVDKGAPVPSSTGDTVIVDPPGLGDPIISYAAYMQYMGWQDDVLSPALAGVIGQDLRLEAFMVWLSGDGRPTGDIELSAHVQYIGWQDYVSSGQLAGTTGQGLRLEAIKVRLTENLALMYDVYYRVYAEGIGWMGWAKNGESN